MKVRSKAIYLHFPIDHLPLDQNREVSIHRGESVCRLVMEINVRSNEVNVPRRMEMMKKSCPRSDPPIQEMRTKHQFQKQLMMVKGQLAVDRQNDSQLADTITLMSCTFYTTYYRLNPHKKETGAIIRNNHFVW